MKQTKKEKYHQYLNSDEWKIKRLEVINKKWCNCEKCWSDKDIQIHHWTYRRLYKEEIKDLFVLCNNCHYELHKKYWTINLLKVTIAFIKWVELKSKKKNKKISTNERIKQKIELYWSFYHTRWKTRVKIDKIMSTWRERNRIMPNKRKKNKN